jgi:Kef-type K+ transport system membrane component KefB
MNLLFSLGIMLIAGYWGGSIAQRLKFPRITGYLIVGFLLNPSVFNLVPQATIAKMEIITYVVLGVISYHIGGGLRLQSMSSLGKAIGWITIFQSLLPLVFSVILIVFAGPTLMDLPNGTFRNTFFPMAFILGAIACSSAPAAIVAIILEGKAKGPVTTTTLAVLALTDALTVFVFSISMGISQPLANGGSDFSLYQMLAVPLWHLIEAALLGTGFGAGLLYAAKRVRTRPLLLVLVMGSIMLCIGIAEHLKISSIFANMVAGFIVANRGAREDMFLVVEDVGDLLFTVFFVLNGMLFDLSGMKNAGVLTLLVILGRWSGKYLGARLGGKIAHAPEAVAKYPGLVLLPKAGLTLGLAFMAKNAFPNFGALMFDALIASTMINMLVTPPLARYALSKSGEGKFE